MSNITISPTQSYDLSTTLSSGTNIEFVGIGGTLTIEPAAITSGGIGGTIGNFDPGDFLTIDNAASIISELGYPSDAGYAAFLSGFDLVIAPDGSVTSNAPFYGMLGSSTKEQIATIANEIEHDLFGPGSLSSALTLSVIPGVSGTYDIVVSSTTDINPCFAAGTRILTAAGTQTAVETLAVGDHVALRDGQTAPVIWIGRRLVKPQAHPNPKLVQPILIARDALADGLPLRDLQVSPDHALLFDGHLIPAKALVNGYTIWQRPVQEVCYYHIELDHHAILLAEGVAAESYLETGNRGAFENGGTVITLHPQFAQAMRHEKSCAPLAEDGPVVEAVRQRILDRARIEITADAGVQIHHENGAAVIASRNAIPGELMADPRDRRTLGVKVARLTIGQIDVPLNHLDLAEGWHEPEEDGRWTNGRGVIPASLINGETSVRIWLVGSMIYPVEDATHLSGMETKHGRI
jgi:hypothetical protein